MKNCEAVLLDMLKAAVNEGFMSDSADKLSKEEWYELMDMAAEHGVASLIYSVSSEFNAPVYVVSFLKNQARKVTYQNYRLLHISSSILRELKKNNINAVLLKGWQAASYYRIPELRKSGDVDILITKKEEFDKAVSILEALGLTPEEHQHANHHVELRNEQGICVELHIDLAEKFADKEVNTNIRLVTDMIDGRIVPKEQFGYPLWVADTSFDAFSLLVHMLHHFMRAGFGIKLLSDWVVFWNREWGEPVKKEFCQHIKSCRLTGFVSAVNSICIRYLGLERDKVMFMTKKELSPEACEKMIEDILEAQEFGRSSEDRLVIMSQTGITGYIKEFHHQMKLNNPEHSGNILCWPYLWVKTLIVFVNNNKKIRKTSTLSVLKNVNKRSKLMTDIEIFKKQ